MEQNNIGTANLQAAKTGCQELKNEWGKHPPNLEKCGQILSKLKVLLTELTFLPVEGEATTEELLLARDILEIGVEWSIAKKDISSFERYISQLKCYYLDYKDRLPESAKLYPLFGLNLLFLLSQNRVAEFHTELELLPPEKIQNNIYIKHPVSLEQSLMEGCYNRVFEAAHIVPAATYQFFMDTLLSTVRGEIAECVEKAYKNIRINDAMKLLNISNQKAMLQFAKDRGWVLNSEGCYSFIGDERVSGAEEEPVHLSIAHNMLQYAKEMEMIV